MFSIMEINNSVPRKIGQPSNNGDGTGSSSANRCLLKLPLTVLLGFVVLLLILGIAWLVMNPHMPAFQLTSLSVTNFTVSDSKLTGDYNVELTVVNPNKKIQVLLDRFNIKVCYHEAKLSELTVSGSPKAPAVYQLEKMSHRNLTFMLESRGPPPEMKHEKVSGDLSADLNEGVVNFNVKVLVRVRFEAGNWPTKEEFLGLLCSDLGVFFDKTKDIGKLLAVGKDCRVYIR